LFFPNSFYYYKNDERLIDVIEYKSLAFPAGAVSSYEMLIKGKMEMMKFNLLE
jgi:hypothetical protein